MWSSAQWVALSCVCCSATPMTKYARFAKPHSKRLYLYVGLEPSLSVGPPSAHRILPPPPHFHPSTHPPPPHHASA